MLYFREDDFAVVDRLTEVAAKRGAPNMQVALAWMLAKPGITAPIVGATKPGHLDDAIAALSIRLSDEEMQRLEEPYRPHPVLGIRTPRTKA
jgi:1-deoxyxylulose-5-phosphate synthase